MAKTDKWTSLFWFFFALFAIYESYEMGLGRLREPGPGLVFFWTGVVIACLSLVVMAKAWFSKEGRDAEEVEFPRSHLLKVGYVLLALLLYALTIEWLGFIIVTLLLFLFLLGVVEKKGWLFASFVSLLVTALSYLLFETALESQLPMGLLDRFLH